MLEEKKFVYIIILLLKAFQGRSKCKKRITPHKIKIIARAIWDTGLMEPNRQTRLEYKRRQEKEGWKSTCARMCVSKRRGMREAPKRKTRKWRKLPVHLWWGKCVCVCVFIAENARQQQLVLVQNDNKDHNGSHSNYGKETT